MRRNKENRISDGSCRRVNFTAFWGWEGIAKSGKFKQWYGLLQKIVRRSTCSFIGLFNAYVSAYFVEGIVPSPGDTAGIWLLPSWNSQILKNCDELTKKNDILGMNKRINFISLGVQEGFDEGVMLQNSKNG